MAPARFLVASLLVAGVINSAGALGAGRAFASSGIVGGVIRSETPDRPALRYLGWDAGLLALSPDQGSFWRFTYGRSTGDEAPGDFSAVDGRVGFRLAGKGAFRAYAGGGTGLGWLKEDGRTVRSGLWSGFGGVIVAPGLLAGSVGGILPCVSCWFDSAGPKCRKCRLDRARSRYGDSPPQPRVFVGIEGGYRKAGHSLSGPEYRAWLGLLL
jgi:hypothetical protein